MSWHVIAVKDKWGVTWQLCCGRGSTNGSLKAQLLRELACSLVVTRCRWGRWGERLWRIGLTGTSRSSWTGQRSYGRQLLLWWSLLSTLCCKLPPASSTIAALETMEIYIVRIKFLLTIPVSKEFNILLPILGDNCGFSSQHHSPPSSENGQTISYRLK
jgi:hypothetical protein